MAKKTTRPQPTPKTKFKAASSPTAASTDGALDLLHRLSETVAVSGDEGPARKIILEAVKSLGDEVKVDPIGNVFAFKHGPPRSPRVMVTAHMDEIGFMIVGVDGDGL